MKVILLNHIEKLGSKGEVVSVKRGFARNYLVPRNLALYASPQNMKQLGGIQAKAAAEEEKILAELKVLDGKIRALNLVFVRKVDENDHMFGSVSETDIISKLHEHGLELHKAALVMDKHIKALGESHVPVRLHKEIISDLQITVEKEAKEQPAVAEPELVEPELNLAGPEPETDEILDEDEL